MFVSSRYCHEEFNVVLTFLGTDKVTKMIRVKRLIYLAFLRIMPLLLPLANFLAAGNLMILNLSHSSEFALKIRKLIDY
jgi:hypothetical protein